LGLSRISIFGFRIFAELTLEIMPSGLRPKPGPLDPDLYFFFVLSCFRGSLFVLSWFFFRAFVVMFSW
jgi:hypothetical protein